VFKQLRVGREPVLVLDGGDFLPGPADSLPGSLDAVLLEAMELMDYDAICPGERDLFRGPTALAGIAARLPLVCANLTIDGAQPVTVPALRRFERGGRSIVLTGVVDPLLYYRWPGAFEGSAARLALVDPMEALGALADSLEAADLSVVLAHASLDRILEMAPGRPEVDVWIQGHEPGLSETPGRVGKAYVIEPGPRSRQIAHFSFDPEAPEKSRLQVLKLARSRRSDSRLDRLIEGYETGPAGTRPR